MVRQLRHGEDEHRSKSNSSGPAARARSGAAAGLGTVDSGTGRAYGDATRARWSGGRPGPPGTAAGSTPAGPYTARVGQDRGDGPQHPPGPRPVRVAGRVGHRRSGWGRCCSSIPRARLSARPPGTVGRSGLVPRSACRAGCQRAPRLLKIVGSTRLVTSRRRVPRLPRACRSDANRRISLDAWPG